MASQLNFCGRGDKHGIGALKLSRIVIGTLFLIIVIIASIINQKNIPDIPAFDNRDQQFKASIFMRWVASSS